MPFLRRFFGCWNIYVSFVKIVKKNIHPILFFLLVLLSSCNTFKFVPKGEYLLDKTKIEFTDTKQLSSADFKNFQRQQPNSTVLGFWKLKLDIYNTAPLDTVTKSQKSQARLAHRMGEPPVVYSEQLTRASVVQLTTAMHNKGYFNATVDTLLQPKNRKMRLTYRITAGEPYRLRHSSCAIDNASLLRAADSRRSLLKQGMLFDADVLDSERKRIASAMRRMGYFYVEKDMMRFVADSAFGTNEVDVELRLQQYIEDLPDSLRSRIFRRYRISDICFHMDYDPKFVPDSMTLNSEQTDGYSFTWVGDRLLRKSALKHNCAITPGEYFNERHVERTYEMLNNLGVIKYVDISFKQNNDSTLECHVVMSRTKLNTVSAEVEGTYSAGDWGVNAGVGYINRNIFHGAEELQLTAKGGYEWRQTGGHAIEAKGTASLAFPIRLKVLLSYQYQTRPDEFTRTVASASLNYTLPNFRRGWTQQFNFFDLSYVYLPWMSDEFRTRFVSNNNPLKYSYESHLIDAIGYSARYSGYRSYQPLRSYSEARFFVETAGNVLYGIESLAVPKPAEGVYKLLGVPFAQYTKIDLAYTFHHVISDKHSMVYHAGLGVAVPYGSSTAVPYEKRYFAGGSSHVRGWTARSLGPGAYRGSGTRIDYDNQTGDIHLDLNLEYRWKVWSIIELAAFTDAGNIWTIYDYSTQPHGAFKFTDFYKQIAWSYGVGVRLDLTFLIFRVDFGVKLYDPTRLYYDQKQWRTVSNGLGWNDDMTFHFAIGYPF